MRSFILKALLLIIALASCQKEYRPRVFVFTDINIDAGDPDDRQSLIHLLWYADELDIAGIVPDRWYAGGLEACHLAVDAYKIDYQSYNWFDKSFPEPDHIRSLLATDRSDPTKSSWAGKFVRPFPDTRPHYYTDDNGLVEWDYNDPCNTWQNHTEMNQYAKSTLERERPGMYAALIEKLERIYKQ